MIEKQQKKALVIGKYYYTEGIENSLRLTDSEKVVVEWLVENVNRTNLFFDNAEELDAFREEVSSFAVELYRKKYKKKEKNDR